MSEAPYTHHTASVNDITIHYLTAGDRSNPAVVLLHGFTQTSHMWTKDVIPALAKRYFVIAPDLRGSGDLGKPSEGYDKRTLASDVYQVVKGLGITKILLVGHDFGAAVAYAYAAEHRSDVDQTRDLRDADARIRLRRRTWLASVRQRRPGPADLASRLPRRAAWRCRNS